jgi:Domain of unknown function (DUF5666)
MEKLVVRWPLVMAYLVMVAVLLACESTSTGGITPVNTEEAVLRLKSGALETQEENGDWVPVAGESTFEIVGGLASTDPWKVTGNTFATRQSTQIEEGLEPGDLVRVKGIILEDGIWLANSIERVKEHIDPTIILIGKVTSVDPWVVNGIMLNTTSDTIITGEITAGMIVRVEILLLEDGIWEVLSIAPLGDFTEIPGCATITATVISVDGNKLQLAGWPVITLGEDVKIEKDGGGEGTLSADQMVLVVLCASEDGQLVITEIVILNPSEGETPAGREGEKVLVCHKPDKKGGHTLSISSSAVPAHLAHGDKLGPCP